MRFVSAAFALLLVALTGCSSGNGHASRSVANDNSAKATPQKVCDWLAPEWRDGADLGEGTPDGPGSCTYEDAIDGGVKVRISIRSRTGRPEPWTRQKDEAAVMVAGLGAPAAWITTGPSVADPATTAATVVGTEDRVSGRLVVSPAGYLVTVHVSGEFNNSRMAEDVARLLLDRL